MALSLGIQFIMAQAEEFQYMARRILSLAHWSNIIYIQSNPVLITSVYDVTWFIVSYSVVPVNLLLLTTSYYSGKYSFITMQNIPFMTL